MKNNGLLLSEDQEELFVCSTVLNVYRHDGTVFALNQSIALGYLCYGVQYVGNLLMVHGLSSQIQFYQFNGTAYTFQFSTSTSESAIYELNVDEDGSKLIFGGDSQNISTYALK